MALSAGCARALLAQALALAAEGGAAMATLRVRAENRAALQLYAALRFEAVGGARGGELTMQCGLVGDHVAETA